LGGREPCVFRKAQPDESGRAASLCRPEPARPGEGPRHGFVAVRTRPVERLVAAAFWHRVPETDGTLSAEFRWSALPTLGRELPDFLEALALEVAAQEPAATTLAAADRLPDGHPAGALLQAAGFAPAGTQTVYHADAAAWREALDGPDADGELLPVRGEHFDALRGLLCGASLRPSELAHGFQSGWSESPSLFDPRCSAVIVAGGGVVAACLANASRGHLTLAALAGPAEWCERLLHHGLQAHDKLPEPATLSFQLDDRDPPGALAGLLEKLPHTVLGRVRRLARSLAIPPARMPEEKGTLP
jgi:hypothetical protein